jgi:hypothetical protein
MHTYTGYIAAPVLGLLAAIAEADEVTALPPALACVLDTSLHMRFIARRSYTSRVQEQTARLAVLHEGSRRPRVEWIRPSDRCRKIIENQTHR